MHLKEAKWCELGCLAACIERTPKQKMVGTLLPGNRVRIYEKGKYTIHTYARTRLLFKWPLRNFGGRYLNS